MSTVITEVEAVVNSRPLTYVYNDIEEGGPLTPGHLLCGRRLVSLPDVIKDTSEIKDPDFIPDSSKDKISKILKIRNLNMMKFWSCWRKEYLVNLREHDQVRTKRKSNKFVPKINAIVLLGDQTPRAQWKLAKIVKLLKGRDGVARAAEIITSTGSKLERSIEHLYPLEVDEETITVQEDISDNDNIEVPVRPQRKAANEANRKIRENLS